MGRLLLGRCMGEGTNIVEADEELSTVTRSYAYARIGA